jgi:hypothetical protein
MSVATHPTLKDENGRPLINADSLYHAVANKAILTAKTIPNDMSELIEKTKEARESLAQAVTGIGENMERLKPAKKEMLEELRTMRMSAATEVSSMLKSLEDLRKFFLGESHDEEMKRLKEFVETCERLKALKDSGFLDTVADTMLKLS